MTSQLNRRDMLRTAGGLVLVGNCAPLFSAQEQRKVFRIGVASASILGKPQARNGHTWHFAQYLHPKCDFDALQNITPKSSLDGRRYIETTNCTSTCCRCPTQRSLITTIPVPPTQPRSPRSFPKFRSPPVWRKWPVKLTRSEWAMHQEKGKTISIWSLPDWLVDYRHSATSDWWNSCRYKKDSRFCPQAQCSANVGKHL